MLSNFDGPDGALWTLSANASISTDAGAHSAPDVLLMTAFGGNLPFAPVRSANAMRTFSLPLLPRTPVPVRIWVRADSGAGAVLSFTIGSGSDVWTFSTGSLGAGWQLWEPGFIVPSVPSVVSVTIALVDPVHAESASWALDDFQLDEGAVGNLAKWSAVANAVAVLKSINGSSGGYKTNFENRIFTRLFTPAEEPDQMFPYACFPLSQDGERITYEGRAFTSRWSLQGHAFFRDNSESFPQDALAATKAAADLRDDLIRAFMSNQHLSGQTKDAAVTSVDTDVGVIADGFAEVSFIVEFEQIGSAADLAP